MCQRVTTSWEMSAGIKPRAGGEGGTPCVEKLSLNAPRKVCLWFCLKGCAQAPLTPRSLLFFAFICTSESSTICFMTCQTSWPRNEFSTRGQSGGVPVLPAVPKDEGKENPSKVSRVSFSPKSHLSLKTPPSWNAATQGAR